MLLWKRRGLRETSKAGREELIFSHVLLPAHLLFIPSVAAREKKHVWYILGVKSTIGEGVAEQKETGSSKINMKKAMGYTVVWKLCFSRQTGNMEDKRVGSAMVECVSWIGLKNKMRKAIQRNSISEELLTPHKTYA